VPAARKADVLASTALAGPGETVEVTFKVPAKAGAYPYLCTFPGHFAAGMKGEITVK
jgi:azurin